MGRGPHRELGLAFADIARDPENKVLILTGDDFIALAACRSWRTDKLLTEKPPEDSPFTDCGGVYSAVLFAVHWKES